MSSATREREQSGHLLGESLCRIFLAVSGVSGSLPTRLQCTQPGGGHEHLSSQCCGKYKSVRHLRCRAQKSVETALADLGMTATPDMSTRETCGAWLALRREIIDLNDLKRRVQVRADGAGSVGPEGRGKRTHKGKVTSQACPHPPQLSNDALRKGGGLREAGQVCSA